MFTLLLSWTGLKVSIPYRLLNFSRKSKATSFFRSSSSLRTIILNVLAKPTFKVNLKYGNTVSDQNNFVTLILFGQFVWLNKVIRRSTWHCSITGHIGRAMEFPPKIQIYVNSTQDIFLLPDFFATLQLFLNINHKLLTTLFISTKYLFTDDNYFLLIFSYGCCSL